MFFLFDIFGFWAPIGVAPWHSEIGDTMRVRHQSREDSRMRGIRDWTGRERLGKTDGVFGEAVQRRSLDRLIAKAVDVIGAKCIDRRQENIGLRSLFFAALGRKTGRQNRSQDSKHSHSAHRN